VLLWLEIIAVKRSTPELVPEPTPIRQREINWMLLRTRMAWAYEGAVPAAYRDSAVLFTEHAAWLIVKGSVRVAVGGEEREAGIGMWVLPGKGAGAQRFSSDAVILSLRFNLEWPTGQALFNSAGVTVLSAAKVPQLELAGRHLLNVITAAGGDEARRDRDYFLKANVSLPGHLKVQGAFLGWLDAWSEVLITRGQAPLIPDFEHAGMVRLLHVLQQCPLDQRISRKEAARFASLSEAQLHRKFTTLYGITPHEVLERRRAEYALQAVTENQLRAKEVASNLGFKSLSQFSTWFRRIHACSPRVASSRGARV
jgi:AraC-like DNA-binding protein